MAYANQDYAIVLPQNLPSIGETIQGVQARKERQQQRADAISEKQREFDQRNALAQSEKEKQNRLFNLKQIQEATEQKQYETPYQKVNNAIGSELGNIYKEALNYIGESPEFVSTFIRNKIQNASQWHDLAINDAKRIQQQQQEFNKTLPNTDLNKVTGIVSNEFENNYFDKDANGQIIGLKAPHLIKPEVNYFEKLNNPDVLAGVVNDSSPVFDFFKGVPKTAFQRDNYTSKAGKVVATKIGGYGTPYSGLVTGDENNPEIKPASIEAPVKDANGNPIKLATPELAQAMNSNPKVSAAFEKLWNDEKLSKGLYNLDPHVNDILKENFRYRLAENQLPHEVKKVEVQKTPITNINLPSQKENIPFKDAYEEIVSKMPSRDVALSFNKLSGTTQNTVLNLARGAYGKVQYQDPNDPTKTKERELNQSDIVIYKNPNNKNELGVWTVKADAKGTPRIDQFIAPLPSFDVNIGVNKGVKGRQESIKRQSYDINGKIYTHDQLIKLGYNDSQIQQALKKGNIKNR